MASRATNRRFLCLLTAMLFGISAVTHAYAMTGAAVEMAPAATEISMSDHGTDCGGDDNAVRANCIAACATAIAILCDPVRMPIPVAIQDIAAIAQLPAFGRGIAPEPHPPKRLI
jgi:hypothetical protein